MNYVVMYLTHYQLLVLLHDKSDFQKALRHTFSCQMLVDGSHSHDVSRIKETYCTM